MILLLIPWVHISDTSAVPEEPLDSADSGADAEARFLSAIWSVPDIELTSQSPEEVPSRKSGSSADFTDSAKCNKFNVILHLLANMCIWVILTVNDPIQQLLSNHLEMTKHNNIIQFPADSILLVNVCTLQFSRNTQRWQCWHFCIT